VEVEGTMKFREMFTEEQLQCRTKGVLNIGRHGLWSASLHCGEIIDLRWNWLKNTDNNPVKIDESLPVLVRDYQLFLAWFRQRGEGIGKHYKTAGLFLDSMIPMTEVEIPGDTLPECEDDYPTYLKEVVPHLLDCGCIFAEGLETRPGHYRYLL
jgi:hypothetical protein